MTYFSTPNEDGSVTLTSDDGNGNVSSHTVRLVAGEDGMAGHCEVTIEDGSNANIGTCYEIMATSSAGRVGGRQVNIGGATSDCVTDPTSGFLITA